MGAGCGGGWVSVAGCGGGWVFVEFSTGVAGCGGDCFFVTPAPIPVVIELVLVSLVGAGCGRDSFPTTSCEL